MNISFVLNGKPTSVDVEPSTLLCDLLREKLGLTGTHVGCDTSQCGACVVHVDDLLGKELHAPCRGGRWRRRQDRRGPRQARRAAPDAARLSSEPRTAVRLLHAGHADERGRIRPAPSGSDRRRRAPLARRQSVPLHGLSEHRDFGVARHRGDARRTEGHEHVKRHRHRRATAPQGGSALPHRPGQLCRRHQTARHGGGQYSCAHRTRMRRSSRSMSRPRWPCLACWRW